MCRSCGAHLNPFRTLTGYALSTAALASGLALGWFLYQSSPVSQFPEGKALGEKAFIPSEAGMFRASAANSIPGYLEKVRTEPSAEQRGGRGRNQALFQSRRAYDGAPPRIPHPVTDSLPGMNCVSCHSQGGWVEKFQAFAPMTPHPEFTQCRQCHVPERTSGLFSVSHFQRTAAEASRPAYEGAPPPMPHGLQMRENCSTCHVGPGAVKEIRTPHPERINCMQCHVAQSRPTSDYFRRASGENQ